MFQELMFTNCNENGNENGNEIVHILHATGTENLARNLATWLAIDHTILRGIHTTHLSETALGIVFTDNHVEKDRYRILSDFYKIRNISKWCQYHFREVLVDSSIVLKTYLNQTPICLLKN